VNGMDLSARLVSARAITDDFIRASDAFIDQGAEEPNWQAFFFRLACELRHLCGPLGDVYAEQQKEAARLAEIRTVLAAVLDSETADRQYALEAIQRIADGGAA
jgi:hypothetical protein